ncbi:MAG: hypothetical protein R6U78_16645 [Bacteroidales bacterium]
MTEKQEKKIALQKAVMEVMEKNNSKWRSVSEMKNDYDQFVRNLKKIDDHISVIQTDLAPLKENRFRSKKELIDQVFPVISVTGVYAYDAGDKKLEKYMNRKFSELEKMKGDELKNFSGRVLKICRSLMEKTPEIKKKDPVPVITDYGLTAKHLERLKKSLDQFIRDDETLAHSKKAKKKSGKKLDRQLRENEKLLRKKLDRMMQLFRDSQKAFYEAYIRSRLEPEKEKSGQEMQQEAVSPESATESQAGKNKEQAAGTPKTET